MTDHVPGRLLVSGFPLTDDAPWLVELGKALGLLGLTFRLTSQSLRRIRQLRGTQGRALDLLDDVWVSTVVLETQHRKGRAPQAWWVLERLRQVQPTLAERLSLVEVRRPASMGSDPLSLAGFRVPA